MNQPPITPEERFDKLVESFLGNPDITPPSPGNSFGSSGLKFRSKIFAMLVRGQLVVKLPKSRVDALVASGDGVNFDANRGRPMKEWLTLATTSQKDWLDLMREALAFIASQN